MGLKCEVNGCEKTAEFHFSSDSAIHHLCVDHIETYVQRGQMRDRFHILERLPGQLEATVFAGISPRIQVESFGVLVCKRGVEAYCMLFDPEIDFLKSAFSINYSGPAYPVSRQQLESLIVS